MRMDSGFRPHELYLVDVECQAPFADAGSFLRTRRRRIRAGSRRSRKRGLRGEFPAWGTIHVMRQLPYPSAVTPSAWIAGDGVRLGIVSALSSSWFRASRSPHTLGGDPVMHAQTATAAATTDGRYSNFVPQATAQCILGPNRG